ncbi:sulfotransferase family 2 domain-containing protein [Truepera radiovictrix]|uniref:Chondroitin 4-O-sulfotransferase n=1 Tax=Truepera radiovictrix (strain DSM 17093 / CIP 108686 / LMG 22925 / RQ-24) TaxID=649638 RepID=D7CY97_TRURR|nr:sulfotransferase family 2 domain-containing protein [Truepera radiovictrix]ADI14736.1 hypothetical protein Trad_1617 [Truepera radiovictrix DSM 17093]WMT56714.1 sulfotransferase family 2 domain-containing protein [Truepera radiovictrix]
MSGLYGGASGLFWQLPYGLRRNAARVAFPRRYAALQRLRSPEAGGALAPFFRHRCLFIHVPKAAGLSVGKGLFGAATGHHRTVAGYQLLLSRSEFEAFFKFAFVRNPWDRLASAFFFLKSGGLHDTDARWAAEHLAPYATFEAFVTGWVNRHNVHSWVHFRPQHHYLCLPGRRELLLDFVGFFENLASDYELIRARLGTGEPLPAENVTRARRDFRELYTPEMREIVARVYREDIALLGYTFDNSSLAAQLARRPAL